MQEDCQVSLDTVNIINMQHVGGLPGVAEHRGQHGGVPGGHFQRPLGLSAAADRTPAAAHRQALRFIRAGAPLRSVFRKLTVVVASIRCHMSQRDTER